MKDFFNVMPERPTHRSAPAMLKFLK